MTAKLRAAAQAALARPRFRELLKLIPREELDDPRALVRWLTTAAEFDPKGGDSQEFHQAYTALSELVRVQDLQDQIARVYWDPKLRAEFGAEAIERAWSDPQTAREMLVQASAAGRLSPAADTALRTIYEVEQFASEQGAPLQPTAAAPIPADDALDTEYRALVDRSATGRLGASEDQRLTSLAEAKVAREAQQDAAAGQTVAAEDAS